MANIIIGQTVLAIDKVKVVKASIAYALTQDRDGNTPATFVWSAYGTDGNSAFSADLEVSTNGTTWLVVDTATDSATRFVSNLTGFAYVRAKLTAITHGKVSVSIRAEEGNAGSFNGAFAVSNPDSFAPQKSFQSISADLSLGPTAGKDIASGTAFLAPIMGNLLGDALTKTGNYLAGVIAEDSVTGTQATTLVKGGVLGIIADGVSASDGAVVAVLDGDDGGLTTPNAMFKAKKFNSTSGNDPAYGLDLLSDESGYLPLVPSKADIRVANDVCQLQKAGVPSTEGTGFAGTGSLCIDTANGDAYINVGSKATPSWKKFTHA